MKIQGERRTTIPKRIIDFDALWASDKLAACQEQNRVEYSWLYGLADANGSFEITNPRVVWGKVSPVRPSLTLERLADIFRDFEQNGLLFTWSEGGKKFAHWTGSEKPGRLPVATHRSRYVSLAPRIPLGELAAYAQTHGFAQSGVNPDVVRTGLGFGVGLGLDGNGRERCARVEAETLDRLKRTLKEGQKLLPSVKRKIEVKIQEMEAGHRGTAPMLRRQCDE